MKLVLIKTVWGCPEMADPSQWSGLLERIKAAGFGGVETSLNGLPKGREEEFGKLVLSHGLRLITQAHTCNYEPRPAADAKALGTNSQGVVGSQSVDEHIADLRRCLVLSKRMGAELVNSHSGHDSWPLTDGVDFLTRATALAEEVGIRLSHETHRRRLLWNPWNALALASAVPGIRITADLSHWVCACERVFDAESDKEWPEVLGAVADRAALIHARVGYNEGPQVPHPAAPEAAFEVESHLSWWRAIVEARLAAGDEEILVEPEFGAPGYQRTTAFTREAEGDLWEINNYMAARVVRMCQGVDGVEANMPPAMAAVLAACDKRAAEGGATASASPAAPWSLPSFVAGAAVGAVAAGAVTGFLLSRRG